MTGPAGKIVGTKAWTFTLAGMVPPGMNEQDVQVWVLNAITIAVALMQQVKLAEINIVDELPPRGGQALLLHQ